MDYEHRYKQAIEKIRNGLQPLSDGAKISGVTRAFLEEVFPELKEGEDERIRKALVRFHKSTIDVDGIKGEDIIAWLEKQDKQKSKWSDEDANTLKAIIYTVKNSGYNYCIGVSNEEMVAWLEKQGERKITHEEICKSYGIPNIGEFSDGYHTFNGLYKQRMILFAVLVKTYKDKAWKSWKHEDGLDCFGGGWFIVGIDTPAGTYTYHYEAKDWDRFDCKVLEKAKHWDGHDEFDVERLFTLVGNYDENEVIKCLINGMKFYYEDNEEAMWGTEKFSMKVKDILSWLEKQKSVGEIVERCKNSWYNEGKIAGMAEGLTDDEKYQQGWHDALEKQGEKKPIMNVPTRELIFSIWDLGNEWKELTNGRISTEYGTQLDYIQKHWHESEYYLREKQGEQKVPINDFKAKNWYVSEVDGKIHDMTYNPADKVEPKFKVRDWIINDQGSAFQIAYIDEENCRYVFEIGGYTKEEMNYENIAFANNHYRKWTIEDAKDGDILTNGEIILIFKQFEEPAYKQHIIAYIGLDISSNIQVTDDYWQLGVDKVSPTTKEQRELLFQKMKEAGYEWDAEKKELKLLISNGGDFESNNSKQKPTWSEDDERMCQETIDWFEKKCFPYALEHENPARESIMWLKSLKERLL